MLCTDTVHKTNVPLPLQKALEHRLEHLYIPIFNLVSPSTRWFHSFSLFDVSIRLLILALSLIIIIDTRGEISIFCFYERQNRFKKNPSLKFTRSFISLFSPSLSLSPVQACHQNRSFFVSFSDPARMSNKRNPLDHTSVRPGALFYTPGQHVQSSKQPRDLVSLHLTSPHCTAHDPSHSPLS